MVGLMNKAPHPVEVLKRTAALAKTDSNLEMLDCAAILHGYMELSALHPEDLARKKDVVAAVGRLLKAASRYPNWDRSLSELAQVKRSGR